MSTVRKAVIASALGNAMEWFDYGVFTSGAMATIVGNVFFPGGNSGVLASFTVLALGFVIRPFGGMFFGPLGDKLGRQKVLAMTIILMSACTFLVGVLPGYSSIGILAPIVLVALRMVQGFSTGGEYGGAATFIAEYAPAKRRGFLGSFLEFGTLGGYVLGQSLMLILVEFGGDGKTATLQGTWYWRIAFWVALPLGLIGLYLRTKLEDTPAFQNLDDAEKAKQKLPLLETLKAVWPRIMQLIGIVFLLNIADYFVLTTMPSYLQDSLKISDTTSSLIIIGIELGLMVIISPLGALSDRIGRKPLLIVAAIGFIVLAWPAVWLMQGGNILGVVVGVGILGVLLVIMLAVIGSTFPAMFPTKYRYGAFAIGYNVSTSVFGGTAAILITALIKATGSNYIPAYYLILAGIVGIVPILFLKETAGKNIETISVAGEPEPALAGAKD